MKIILGLAIGLPVTVVIAFAILGAVSRSGSPPGLQGTQLQPCGSRPNCVSSMMPADAPSYVAALTFDNDSAESAWVALINEITGAGGTIVENAPPYLAATFRSKVFGFVDDVEARIDSESNIIHLRSASRVGYSDGGVNRQRIEDLTAALR